MANDRGRSRLILARGSVILAVLAATYGYLLLREVPSQGADEAAAAAVIQANAEQQAAASGACQDPLAAIETPFEMPGKRAIVSEGGRVGGGIATVPEPLSAEKAPAELAAGVMVPGGSDPSAVLQRKRIRCAIAAGLARLGFVAEDSSRIDYILSPHASQDERAAPAPTLQRRDHAWGEPDQQSVIPFEWFVQSGFDKEKHVLVLWLNEQILSVGPLRKLSLLKRFLYANPSLLQRGGTFKVVGPFSSVLLDEMVKEAQTFIYTPPYQKAFGQLSEKALWPDLADVQFYAYGTTADDRPLLGDMAAIYGTAQHFFAASGIYLQRITATERTLARGLVHELRRRRIVRGAAGGDVVLISDGDSYSGRSVSDVVELAFGHMRPGGSALRPGAGSIHKLTYLRGLDGPLSGSGTEAADGRATELAAGEQRSSARDVQVHQYAGAGVKRSPRQAQSEALQSISEQLNQLDRGLRHEKRRIAAIGVLGSNARDKLAILRALRRQFPQTPFFTTDYDQVFTLGSEVAWTRNLIVASSYGPVLHERIQRGIPAFQSTYETSAFLAALLATSDAAKDWTTPAGDPSYFSEQLLAPRIFEIAKNGNLLSFPGDGLPILAASPHDGVWKQKLCPENSADCDASRVIAGAARVVEGRSSAQAKPLERAAVDCDESADPANCGNIQPPTEKLFPQFEKGSQYFWGLSFALGAMTIMKLLHIGVLPRRARVEAWFSALAIAAFAAACMFWERLAQFLTEHGDGEPVALMQSVSVWPAIGLRGLGIGLAVYFIFRAQRSLGNNLGRIAVDLKLDMARPGFRGAGSFRRIFAASGNWRRFTHPAAPAPVNAAAVWSSYVAGEAFWARLCRVLCYMAAIYLFTSFAAGSLFENPSVPVRGPLAASAYHWTALLYALAMLLLTCFVLDAAHSCRRFLRNLRDYELEWPASTMRLFDFRLQLGGDAVRQWINLEIGARRARCIGLLTYYPLALLALLIVADSSAFAKVPPSLLSVGAAGASLAALFVCVIALAFEANRQRAAAKQNLFDAMVSADCDPASSTGAGRGIIEIGVGRDLRDGELLKTVLRHLDRINEGAYGSFARLPLVLAVLLLAGGLIWTVLDAHSMAPSSFIGP